MLGSGPARGIRFGTTRQTEIAPSPSMDLINSVSSLCRCIHIAHKFFYILIYTYYYLGSNFVQFLNSDFRELQHSGNCFQCGV